MKLKSLGLAVIAASIAIQTQAAPILLSIGNLTGNTDLSGLNGNIESGVPANLLGGTGSAIAYAGANTFIVLPDRGPNAQAYNGGAAVDNTTSYIPRMHTINMSLTASSSGALPFTLTPSLADTTLFFNKTPLNYATGGAPAQNTAERFYFSGRSDNFSEASSTNPANGRLDPEAIRVSNDGKSVFVSDEYGPYVYQFDRATGERIKAFALPASLAINNPDATETAEIAGNTNGRTTNKGMEGLAITPDGKKLVGIMQAPLLQDTNKSLRLVTIDIATGATEEFAYQLTNGSGVSEILALNDHEFLVLERDGKGLGDNSNAKYKEIYQIDISGAQSVAGSSGNLASKAVSKSLVLDVKTALQAAGIAPENIPAKIEGIAFGEDILFNNINYHTLWVTNDNDFLANIIDSKHPLGIANTNNFYVFGFTDADLANFVQQKFNSVNVPEPSTLLLLLAGIGMLAGASLRRRQKM